MCIRDSEKAARISEVLRDAAYEASADLAKERGAFKLFNADLLLSGNAFEMCIRDSPLVDRPASGPGLPRLHRGPVGPGAECPPSPG